jgi:hypothetical protein
MVGINSGCTVKKFEFTAPMRDKSSGAEEVALKDVGFSWKVDKRASDQVRSIDANLQETTLRATLLALS